MYPAEFDYYRPQSLAEALDLLKRFGDDAKLLAGGHSLLPAMRLRLARPKVLIDISRLPELAYIRREDGAVAIGALTLHSQVEHSHLLAASASAFPDAARVLADVQVRNRGTVGGALAHADPAADYPAVVLALGATIHVAGPAGTRTIAADQFFFGPFITALAQGEIVTEIRVPAAEPGTGSAYIKFVRRANEYAYAGVAAWVTVDAGGVCRAARVAVTAVGPHAYRATETEEALVGRVLTHYVVQSAAARVTTGIDITDDPYVPADYRSHLATVIAAQAIAVARDRAMASR